MSDPDTAAIAARFVAVREEWPAPAATWVATRRTCP